MPAAAAQQMITMTLAAGIFRSMTSRPPFLGALVLGGFRRGTFVSSSRFSRGAISAARRITQTIMPIELVDCERFFDILGCAQLLNAPTPEQCIEDAERLKFHVQACYHLNTL
ncbi:MAG TPA: hypothetical protein VFL64_07840 [Rhizobacter sp.]|nr:hypothetical protein [Rhizobacter sp.]